MRRSLGWAGLAAAVAGWTCAPQPNVSPPSDAGMPDAGVLPDSGPDAGPDGGISCDNPLASSDMACGTLAWAKSTTTSRLRNHQLSLIATSAAGPFLYVLGGVNGSSAGGVLSNADMAPINPDGSLGKFTATTPLSIAVAGATGGLLGNVVVIAGGHGPSAVTDLTFSSVIQSDGTLGPWTKTGSMLHPRMHGAAIVFGNTIYILGGFDGGSQVWSDIVSATVNPDGSLSPWTTAGSLPQPLSHFTAALVGTHVYLTGGINQSAFDSPPALTNVYQGTIASDGTLGNWVDMTALPTGLATHASFVYGGHLYVAGGVDNIPAFESGVWSSPINDDGTLGAWTAEASLPIARAHVHQLPMLGNHFYSVAGAIDPSLKSTSEVDVGTFE